jgi:Right handed beta helix region
LRKIPLLLVLVAVPLLHAETPEPVVLAPSATPYPPVTLKEGQSLRSADPARRAVVAGIIVTKGATISDIDVDANGAGTAIKATGGDLTLERVTIRNAANRGLDAAGASSLTLRDVQLVNNAARNGVSAVTCAGDVGGNALAPCNASLFVQNAGNVTLERVLIDGSAQLGFAAENVSGLRMTGVEVKNAGNESNESGVVLRNVGGDITLTNCRLHDSAARELQIESTRAGARVRIDHSTLTHGDAVLAQALLAEASGEASLTLDIANSTLSAGQSNALQANGTDSGKLTLHVTGSTFDRNAGAILAGVSSHATLDYALANNTLRHSSLGAIYVTASGDAVVRGTIAHNEITASATGIRLTANMHGRLTATVDANTMHEVEADGVRLIAGDGADARVDITGNTLPGIAIQAGTRKQDTATICADLRDNTSTQPIALWNRFPGTTVKLPGLTGAAAAYVARRNHNARVEAKLTTDPAGNAFAGGERCIHP